MQLPVAHVERDHARRAALQKHVREPAGRRADVEAVDARRRRPRRRRAHSRACARRATRTAAARRPRAVPPRPPARPASSARDASGHHERLRLRARLGEPTLDEQDVKPLLHAASVTAGSPPIAQTLGCGDARSRSRRSSIAAVARSVGCDADPRRDRPGDRRSERHQDERTERVVRADARPRLRRHLPLEHREPEREVDREPDARRRRDRDEHGNRQACSPIADRLQASGTAATHDASSGRCGRNRSAMQAADDRADAERADQQAPTCSRPE